MHSKGNGPANYYHQNSIDDKQFLNFDARRAINYKVAILDQFYINVLHLDAGVHLQVNTYIVCLSLYYHFNMVFFIIWTNLVKFEISQYMLCLQNQLFNKDVFLLTLENTMLYSGNGYNSSNHPGNSSHWYPYQVLPTTCRGPSRSILSVPISSYRTLTLKPGSTLV